MLFETNKQKGNAGLGMAIAYFSANGYTVSIPLNDTQDYDLIIEKDEVFQTVQCKATNYMENGNYQIPLASCGGTKGIVYKTFKDTNVDLLFALCGDGTMYVIPRKEVKVKRYLSLTKELSKYAKPSTLDTSKYIVTL